MKRIVEVVAISAALADRLRRHVIGATGRVSDSHDAVSPEDARACDALGRALDGLCRGSIDCVSLGLRDARGARETDASGTAMRGTVMRGEESGEVPDDLSASRWSSGDPEVIASAGLVIDRRSHTVTRDGMVISLTPREFDILYVLAVNRGIVLTKDQIYRAVWRGDYVMDDNNIMAFIRKLRKKIEPNPDAPEYIMTIWGVGYRFNDRP